MRKPKARAWILLSIPDEAKPLSYILGMADGLNKAIPTLDELRDSIGWLRAVGLISAHAGEFQRTEAGRSLISGCEVDGDSAFDLWDKIASALETTSTDTATPYELTAEELQDAYDEYRRRIQATYQRLQSADT